jgi:hypothetical protein
VSLVPETCPSGFVDSRELNKQVPGESRYEIIWFCHDFTWALTRHVNYFEYAVTRAHASLFSTEELAIACTKDYSYRNAVMGSTRSARRAGI